MTAAAPFRPEQPEPFLRGVAYEATAELPYPRANPKDAARLPGDVWHAAAIPAGVRLELVGDADAVDLAYRTTTGNLGYRGDGAGIVFSVWRGGQLVAEEEATLGDGMIRLPLGTGPADAPATIYLPEGMQPVVLSLTAVRGELAPAPRQPRWLAYGDAVTQGWIASGPAQGWAAIVARKCGLDLVNLGYAAAGRGEVVSAEHLADLSADVITVAYGASCWTRTPHSVGMVAEGLRGFLDVVRRGHPDTPVVVVSPLRRPDAEDVPNVLGATLSDLRHAIESVTRERIVDGEHTLSLVSGDLLVGTEHLADGIHPGDEGHRRIAAAVAKTVAAALDPTPADAMPDELVRGPARSTSAVVWRTAPTEVDVEAGTGSAVEAPVDGEAEVETGTEAESGAEAEVEAGSGADVEPIAEPVAEADATPDLDGEDDPGAEPDATADAPSGGGAGAGEAGSAPPAPALRRIVAAVH